jgi:hypothetical protein
VHKTYCFAVLLGSASCYSANVQADALVIADATLRDAVNTDAPTTKPRYAFIVDSETLPATAVEAKASGLDLDGDTNVDNQLGSVFAVLSSQGLNFNQATKNAVNSGDILSLLDITTLDFQNATGVSLNTFKGGNPMPFPCQGGSGCRVHLQGTGMFTAAATPRDTLVGAFVTGTFTVSAASTLHVSLGLGGTPVGLTLIGGRISASGVSSTGISNLVLAGAITENEMHQNLNPAFVSSLATAIARDCVSAVPPGCGCTNGTTGQRALTMFDTAPQDCTVSLSEFENNNLIKSLLAPDLMVNGTLALSFGIKATAVKATFTP